MKIRLALLSGIMSLLLLSCGDIMSNLEQKPRALGKTNEIIVVCDDVVWESFVRDTVEYYFEAPYPIMPQPEPVFDLRHFSMEDLEASQLRKELRTYLILANLNDTASAATRFVQKDLGDERMRKAREDASYFSSFGMDKWATGQLLIYVFGEGLDNLANHVVEAYPSIAARVQRHDREQIDAATYLNGVSNTIGRLIHEKFGISMKIPGNYQVARNDSNFLWIRQDIEPAISNITIQRFPYTSREQLTKEGIIELRDRMGFRVEGSTPGSVMVTNAEDLPVYVYQKEIAGRFAIEARGIWELTDDFAGGPFVTYAIVDDDEILVIDTFVLAPGEIKRNFVQWLEHIVSSLTF